MTQTELNILLEKHGKWLRNEDGGEQADLAGADLSFLDLSGREINYIVIDHARFFSANLENCRMSHVFGRPADFSYANLRGAKIIDSALELSIFHRCDLRDAEIVGGCFDYANFSCADVRGTIFRECDMKGANFFECHRSDVKEVADDD